MRSKFDQQLDTLHTELIKLGALCEEAIENISTALFNGDESLIEDAIRINEEIDNKERAVERLCLKLLLRQQPVASDLRQISSALKMVTDMARIGDQVADIAEIIKLDNITAVNNVDISDMARATVKMVTTAVDAFVHQNLELAKSVIAYDDIVDGLFNKIKDELIELIVRDRQSGEYAIDLLMTAKYFERIGDHAVNIAEWVVFAITGVHKGKRKI